MAQKKGPPVTVRGAISLIWTLAEVPRPSGGDIPGIERYRDWLSLRLEEAGDVDPQDARALHFFEELWMLMGSALRNLRHYVQAYSDIAADIDNQTRSYIGNLDDLAAITSLNVRSGLPRVLTAGAGAAGAFSAGDLALGLGTSEAVGISVVAALVLAGVAEIGLRWYRNKRVNEVLIEARDRKQLLRLEALGGNGFAELDAFGRQMNRLVEEVYGSEWVITEEQIDDAVRGALPYIPLDVGTRITANRRRGELAAIDDIRAIEKEAISKGLKGELLERFQTGLEDSEGEGVSGPVERDQERRIG